jgi:hypothetical protein
MIAGLFATTFGKGAANETTSGSDTQTEGQSATAVIEPPASTAPQTAQAAAADPAKPDVKACPQCGSTEPWGISSWCPNCFYHPRMGQMMVAPPPPDPEVRHFMPGHSAAPDSYADMLKAIPAWVHPLWMGVVAIFAMSAMMSLKMPLGYERAVWTLAQAGIGFIAAGAMHVLVFFKAVPNTDKYGPFDLFLKPLDFWRYAIHKLPTGAWRLWIFAWGLTATLSALVLIGGVNYASIFETKSTKKKSIWYQTPQVAPGERRGFGTFGG